MLYYRGSSAVVEEALKCRYVHVSFSSLAKLLSTSYFIYSVLINNILLLKLHFSFSLKVFIMKNVFSS